MREKIKRLIQITAVLAVIVCVTAMPAFAADEYSIDTIQSAATETLNTVYKVILTVVAPLSAVAFAWLGYRFLFGETKDGTVMQNTKRYLLTLLVADAAVLLAPVIVKGISGWFTVSVKTIFTAIQSSTAARTPTNWLGNDIADVSSTLEAILEIIYVVYPIASMLAAVSLASAGLKMVLNLPLGCTEKQLERAKAQAVVSAVAFAVLLLLPRVCQVAVNIGIQYAWQPTAFRL